MDITKSELPLTSFWDRIPNTRKKENQPPAGKRKRNDTEGGGGSSLKQKGKGKQPLQDASLLRSRADAKKPKHIYGKPKPSAHKDKCKDSAHKDIRSLMQGVAAVSDHHAEGRDGSGPLKRRRVETSASPSDKGIPTPPPTNGAKKVQHHRDNSAIGSSSALIRAAHHLPTPGTSVPRHVGRVRPSLGKPPLPVAPSSPLAARRVPNSRDPSSSPLSSCHSDDQTPSHSVSAVSGRSHANIAKALLDVAPRQHELPAVDHATLGKESNDDPFSVPAAPAFVPSSQRFEDNLALPPLDTSTSITYHDKENMVTTSPMADTTITTALNSIISPHRSVIESSQSQYLVPHASPPRRYVAKHAARETIESSQSQALLRHAPGETVESSQSQALFSIVSSPHRRRRISGILNGPSSAESSQVVEGSQSQTERKLTLSTAISQLGLFSLPDVVASPEEIPNNREP